MKIVLDSNILFSALISGKELYIDIFRAMDFYAPDFIFAELSKYQEKIIKKTKIKDEFISFAKELFSTITIIPGLAISKESYKKAQALCEDIDPKDAAYVALSIELNLPLWTNDKPLLEGLIDKGHEKLITTKEIFEMTSM